MLGALLPTVAAADPHPMASGATPAPTTEAQVAMTAETLTITIGQRDAAVTAAVTLANPGPPTSLVVGFPCAFGDAAGQIDVPCKVPLAITVDGKRIRTKLARTDKRTGHWLWTMKLAAAATVPVVVAYRAPLINDRYSVPATGMGLFTYRLTTGARWAGPIGKLRITVDHTQDPLLFISPAGYQREAGRITWTLDDHEPTEEVVLVPHPIAASQLRRVIGGATTAEARKRLAAGDYKKADIEAVIAELDGPRRRADPRAQGATDEPWGGDWLTLITRLGGVPAPTQARVAGVVAESRKLLEELAARAKR